ncbi:MAG: hypothetical protein ABSB15_01520, partial [Bryobacteraceae bacterium]
MKPALQLFALISAACSLAPAADKTFIDYFLPTPIHGHLTADAWGVPNVLPRDPQNGLEDPTIKKWCYWDGQIIKGPDGKYHMFASRWDQSKGHRGWFGSAAVHAVSDSPTGPYVDKGLVWPDNQAGKGHNVTALVLPDGRYAVVVSETRPGDVFVAKSLDGPFEQLGSIKVDPNGFDARDGRMSNVSIMVRRDGNFEIVPRSGAILISTTGVLGPYKIQGPSIYLVQRRLVSHRGQLLERAQGIPSDIPGWHRQLDESGAGLRSHFEHGPLHGRDRKPLGEDGAARRTPHRWPRRLLHVSGPGRAQGAGARRRYSWQQGGGDSIRWCGAGSGS